MKTKKFSNLYVLVALSIILVLYLVLRLRWVGHLLVWDEAMNLCAVRAFYSQGQDTFANWFWRHPPFFMLLMLGLHPLSPGFAERVQLLSIGIGVLNLLLLFYFNRRCFGTWPALAASLLLAVMPGSVFFDVWIKRDHPVVTFGLLALIFLTSNRTLYAGICLGLALLCKETALFYVMASLLICVLKRDGNRKRSLATLILIPALIAGWWYLLIIHMSGTGETFGWESILSRVKGLLHFSFALQATAGWNDPWHFYLIQTFALLGPIGLILGITGLAFSFTQRAKGNSTFTLWPVFLLIPSYLLLSLLPAKVAWTVISILPAWATLQGLILAHVIEITRIRLPRVGKILSWTMGSILLGSLLYTVSSLKYEDYLRTMDDDQWRGAILSREIAQTMNREIKDNDRVLLTSFHYWKGISPGHPCPIFTYYFQRNAEVLVRPHTRPFSAVLEDIQKYRLAWALVSPRPGQDEEEIFGGFMQTHHLSPIRMSGAYLFKTTSLLPPLTRSPTDKAGKSMPSE